MKKLEQITTNPLINQVLKDSFGGVMYNVDNYTKYDGSDKDELLNLWNNLSESEKNALGGLIKGAINFLQGN